MTVIYWIRHGEAEGNLYRRCHGQYNSLITRNGRAQFEALRHRFDGVRLDAVYSSDLYRAWATADALAAPRGLTVVTHPGLREISLGIWEDMTWVDVCGEYGQKYAEFTTTPWVFDMEGGESMIHARDRAVAALSEIARLNQGKTIAITSHGMVTRALMTLIQGMSDDQMNALGHGDNTSVSKLIYDDGGFELEYYADGGHLGELSTLAKQKWWRDGSGGLDHGLSFKPADFSREARYYEAFRRDAWMTVYGSTENYNGDAFLNEARMVSAKCPEAVLFAMDGGRYAGVLQMDFTSPILDGAGHISLLYLSPEYRGKNLGIQLVGQAVSSCRRKGREALALRVFDGNARALRFYEKAGFTQFGTEPSFSGKLLLLELAVKVPELAPSVMFGADGR